MSKSETNIPKEICGSLEFVSKQVCVPFGSTKSIEFKLSKTKSKISLTEDDENIYPSKFDDLFIELFGKEQFDKCLSLMDKIKFIREHWDYLK